MGYEKKIVIARQSPKKRVSLFKAEAMAAIESNNEEDNFQRKEQTQQSLSNEAVCIAEENNHEEETFFQNKIIVIACNACEEKQKEIENLNSQCSKLLKQLTAFQWFSHFNLTDDNTVRVFTGLPSKNAWQAVLGKLKEKSFNIRYWTGPSRWLASESSGGSLLG